MYDLTMSRISGIVRAKLCLHSHGGLNGLNLPFAGFDILKRNFYELSYPNLLMRVYYSTFPSANESALDYRFTLNKFIFIADTDEWLRRRGRSAEIDWALSNSSELLTFQQHSRALH